VQPELGALVADLGMEALASVASTNEIVVVRARAGSVLSDTCVGQAIRSCRRSASRTSSTDGRGRRWWRARVRSMARMRRVPVGHRRRRSAAAWWCSTSSRAAASEAVMIELRDVRRRGRPAGQARSSRLWPRREALGPWTGSGTAGVADQRAPVFGPTVVPRADRRAAAHKSSHRASRSTPRARRRLRAVTDRIHGTVPGTSNATM
jgi:hypothetical protein